MTCVISSLSDDVITACNILLLEIKSLDHYYSNQKSVKNVHDNHVALMKVRGVVQSVFNIQNHSQPVSYDNKKIQRIINTLFAVSQSLGSRPALSSLYASFTYNQLHAATCTLHININMDRYPVLCSSCERNRFAFYISTYLECKTRSIVAKINHMINNGNCTYSVIHYYIEKNNVYLLERLWDKKKCRHLFCDIAAIAAKKGSGVVLKWLAYHVDSRLQKMFQELVVTQCCLQNVKYQKINAAAA